MTRYRFAVQGGPLGNPVALAEYAQQVESLGYDELYTADHIGAIDPFIPLVTAAAATSELRFGPLVINNELHHPAMLARTAATFDLMSGGRTVLGMGTGYAQAEHDSINVELRPPRQRVDRFAESLAVLRALLDERHCDFDGDHHHVHIDEFTPEPIQERMPILIGGHGQRVVTLAGRYADIFQFTGLASDGAGWITIGEFDLGALQRRADWLVVGAEEAGRDPGSIERSALVQHVGIGDESVADDELAARFELDERVIAEAPFILNGSEQQVIDKIGRTRERLGISHYVVRDPEQFAPIVSALSSTG